MLCEICHKREATVHLSLCTPGAASVGHREFCEKCFPFESLSNEERQAAIRKLVGLPPADEGGQ
jgi:protein-arginine kinase activator protein McsA